VSGLTFTADPGEWISLFGGSGSGKTTALRLLAGEIRPEAGVVRVVGHSPDQVRHAIGFSTASHSADSKLTVGRLLARETARGKVSASRRSARSAEVVELLGLTDLLDRPLRELSSGERCSVSLAAALKHRPSVLLIDGLDALVPQTTWDTAWRYLEDRRALDGLTVMHATTNSDEADRADKVVLLDAGRQLAFERPSSLKALAEGDVVTIEAADPSAVQRTLRGVFDVEITETRDGIRYRASDGETAAAHHFRHPSEGARAVFIRQPTLWEVIEKLRADTR